MFPILFYIIWLFFLLVHFTNSSITTNPITLSTNKKEILQVGKFVLRKTANHNIDFYQFKSEKSVLLFLRHLKGQVFFYGYSTKSFNTLSITESEIANLQYLGYLDNPKIINIYYYLSKGIDKENNPESDEQYIGIVYCLNSNDEIPECEYSIGFSIEGEPITIKNKEIYHSFSGIRETSSYICDLSDIKLTNNSMLVAEFNLYNGKSTFWVTIDDYQVTEKETMTFHSKDVWEVPLNDKITSENKVALNLFHELNTFFSVRFKIIDKTVNEIDEIIVENGFTFTHEMKLSQQKRFIFDTSLINDKVLFVLNTRNCLLKIQKENENEIVDLDINSFYQTIYNKDDKYTLLVSVSQFEDETYKNENDYCIFYSSGYVKDVRSGLVLVEGIDQKVSFDSESQEITLLYSFNYPENPVNSGIYLEIELSENGKVRMDFSYNNQSPGDDDKYYIYERKSFYLNPSIEKKCVKKTLCIIKMDVTPVIVGNEKITMIVRLQNSESNFTYLPKNVFVQQHYSGGHEIKNSYYAEVIPGEKGIIKINNNYISLLLSYSIIERKNQTLPDEYYSTGDQLDYEVNKECKYGCEIRVKVYLEEQQTIKIPFRIAISKNNEPIASPNYYQIDGTFYKTKSYSYLFTLPLNTRKFQIVLGGASVSITTKDLNETSPCCEKINEVYYPDSSTLFLDFEVLPEIDTSNYHIKIVLKPTMDVIKSISPYYFVKVIPYQHLDAPIHYFSDNLFINCYSGDKKTCRFIFILEEGISNSKIKLFTISPLKNNIEMYLYANEVTEYDIFTNSNQTWEHFFSYDKNESKTSDQFINSYFGRIYGTKQYLFVTIEGDSTHFTANFLSSHPNRYELKRVYLTPNFGRLYEIFSSNSIISPSIRPLIPVNESYKNYQVVMTYRSLFSPYMFNVPGIKTYTNQLFQVMGLEDSTTINLKVTGIPCEMVFKYWIIKKPKVFMLDLNLYSITSVYLNKTLPWEIGYKLGPNEANFTLNILPIQKTEVRATFNYSSFVIEACYLNEEAISALSEGDISIDEFPKPEIRSINNNQVFILDFTISEEQRKKYDYIFIRFKESKKTKENYNDLLLNIKGIAIKEPLPTHPLYPLSFMFNYFKTNQKRVHTYLILSPILNEMSIQEFEFASCACSSNNFKLTYKYENDTELTSDQIKIKYEKGGIKRYRLINNETLVRHIYLYIELNNDNLNDTIDSYYYGIKYLLFESTPESEIQYYKTDRDLSSEYNKNLKKIESKWGTISNINSGQAVQVQYLYFLFNKDAFTDYQSICFSSKPVYQSLIYENITYYEINEVFEFQNALLGYFIDSKNEEIFISYNIEPVNYQLSGLWLWIVLVFIFIVGFFIIASYWLYLQIKKKTKELNEEPKALEIDTSVKVGPLVDSQVAQI